MEANDAMTADSCYSGNESDISVHQMPRLCSLEDSQNIGKQSLFDLKKAEFWSSLYCEWLSSIDFVTLWKTTATDNNHNHYILRMD